MLVRFFDFLLLTIVNKTVLLGVTSLTRSRITAPPSSGIAVESPYSSYDALQSRGSEWA